MIQASADDLEVARIKACLALGLNLNDDREDRCFFYPEKVAMIGFATSVQPGWAPSLFVAAATAVLAHHWQR